MYTKLTHESHVYTYMCMHVCMHMYIYMYMYISCSSPQILIKHVSKK